MASAACASPASDGAEYPVFESTAESSNGMVVTGSPYATEAGRRMLAAGGNAVDAAVAAAFALAVAEPTQSGLGGRTQFLFRGADGETHGIDGTTQVPASYDPDAAPEGEHGHAAVGIPGTVAALTRALAEHGTFALDRVMQPAREWAREGVSLPSGEATRIRTLLEEVDAESALARNWTLDVGPDGEALLVQPVLATTLERIAEEGPDVFYSGSIAEMIADDMAANGGYLTRADLAAYRAEDSEIGTGSYRGHAVVASYLPASGVTVSQILQIMDRIELASLDEAGWAAAVTGSLLAGFEDREAAENMVPAEAVAWLLSDSLADRRAAAVQAALDRGEAGAVVDPAFDDEPPHTSHISVVDADGNVVAMTQSLGPTGGARVMTPGLGFVYASTLGGYLLDGAPGYRPWSSQAPLIVMGDDGPALVMGGAGARRIVSALVATISRVFDHGLDLEAAMVAPRLHPTGGEVHIDEAWDVGPALRAAGYTVTPAETSYFARLNAIQLSSTGALGVAEPGWSGASAAGGR